MVMYNSPPLIVLGNHGSSDMDIILLTYMSLWMKLLSDKTISILPYPGFMYDLEYSIAKLRYLTS